MQGNRTMVYLNSIMQIYKKYTCSQLFQSQFAMCSAVKVQFCIIILYRYEQYFIVDKTSKYQ